MLPLLSVAASHVASTSRRVRIGPFVASHVFQLPSVVPRLKYVRIFSCEASA
jgi:hypothetical protein